MILAGKVGDGWGTASRGLRAPLFRELLGEIHPASLNVFVPGVHRYAPSENYPNIDCIRRQGHLYVRTCKVNGVGAFILRNEHPGPTLPGRRPPPIAEPHTMFEIVARSVIPGVGYAADVMLEFEPGPEFLKRLLVRAMPRDRARRYVRHWQPACSPAAPPAHAVDQVVAGQHMTPDRIRRYRRRGLIP